MQDFRKLAQLEIPKNKGEKHNDVNIVKYKNWKNGKNERNFSKVGYLSVEQYAFDAFD